ncbi:MAG: PspC domain-containing protein [Acidobacteria bacterium]|nr:PspC domain-containing protein [Acidobacteriota bacterium]
MKRLYRSQTDKKLAGIFGGVSEIYETDPSLLRLLFLFLGIATGVFPLLITYLVGWMIIPKGPLGEKGPPAQ